MGLDETVAHLIWAVALVAVLMGATDAFQTTADAIEEGRDAQHERLDLRLSTRFDTTTWCHDPVVDSVVVTSTHLSERPLDAATLTFLLDGVARTTFTLDIPDASDTWLWAPGETARFTLPDVTTSPERVALVTGEGVFRSAVAVKCVRLTTIVITPSDVTLDPGETQMFTATGYDQYGNLFDGAPYTWTTDAGTLTVLSGTSARLTAGTTSGTGFTVTASSNGVDGVANVTIRRHVHVESIDTYLDGAPSTSFKKREVVETRVLVHDHNNALAAGTSVTIELVDPSNVVQYTGTATTDASGIASFTYTLPNNAAFGTWTARVTSLSGANDVYDSAQNTMTQTTFEVIR